eukprot:16257-Heterococcus_DN1.PRE.5
MHQGEAVVSQCTRLQRIIETVRCMRLVHVRIHMTTAAVAREAQSAIVTAAVAHQHAKAESVCHC